MPYPFAIDWKNPDYGPVWDERARRLQRINAEPELIPPLKLYYRDAPWDFIDDWGVTFDPRVIDRGMSALMPFVLFPRQREWLEFAVRKWKERRPALTEKSRDMGLSWLAVSLACTLALFWVGFVAGFGSRKEEYVDQKGAPRSLFYKARLFMAYVPAQFRGGWDPKRDAPHMRLTFPETGSHISGEAGDNIGRGDRTSLFLVDEAAHLERPDLVDASLSQTTNARHDISSVKGMNNPFAQKRHSGKIEVFSLHWRADPRKDNAWYEQQAHDLDPVTLAQEIDINYSASVQGVLIPSAWVQASIDAHVKLHFNLTGPGRAAMDVADEGKDSNAVCGGVGPLIATLDEWSGSGGDIYSSTAQAFGICDLNRYETLRFDSDGLGAGVRGDAKQINKNRRAGGTTAIAVLPFRGSGAVANPKGEDVAGRGNENFFANAKAQGWWSLRRRFQRTHMAVTKGIVLSAHDDLISLSSELPLLGKLCIELSQPTYKFNQVGKMVVDKQPDHVRSPNLADAVMIHFADLSGQALQITRAMIEAI
jgi:phage terminase large subunit